MTFLLFINLNCVLKVIFGDDEKSFLRYFNFCKNDAEWIMETRKSIECWYRVNFMIEVSSLSIKFKCVFLI